MTKAGKFILILLALLAVGGCTANFFITLNVPHGAATQPASRPAEVRK